MNNISVTHWTDTTVQTACQNSTTSMLLTGLMNREQGGVSDSSTETKPCTVTEKEHMRSLNLEDETTVHHK